MLIKKSDYEYNKDKTDFQKELYECLDGKEWEPRSVGWEGEPFPPILKVEVLKILKNLNASRFRDQI